MSCDKVDKLEGAFRTIQADGIINEPMLTELLDNPKVKASTLK